jgi:hypothetical protein
MNKNPYSYKRKRRAPSKKKIVLTVIIAFIAAFALIIAWTAFVSSAHTDPATGLQYKISPNSFTCRIVSAAKCEASEIKVPEKIGLYKVTEISGSAFARIDGLKKVEIPETVTKIGERIFADTGIKEIVIPKSVLQIYNTTFGGGFWGNCVLERLYYCGESGFEDILTGGELPESITVYHYSESEPAKNEDGTYNGNYWRYVDDKPTAWE